MSPGSKRGGSGHPQPPGAAVICRRMAGATAVPTLPRLNTGQGRRNQREAWPHHHDHSLAAGALIAVTLTG
jgi:hypothetical protein